MKPGKTRAAVCLIPILVMSVLEPAAAGDGSGTPLGGPTIFVGPGCTHETIQAAVDAAPASGAIIRVRTGTFNESVRVTDKNIELIGGHQFCFSEALSGRSTIDALNTGPALSLRAVTGPLGREYRLEVRNFNLRGGRGVLLDPGILPGGGLNVVAEDNLIATAVLDNTVMQQNDTNFFGGGAALLGNDNGWTNLRMSNGSRIIGNKASHPSRAGGGLFCAGNGRIRIQGGSITGNVAGVPGESGARGGGIALDGCELEWTSVGMEAGDNWLGDNVAHGGGGGMYLSNGADVTLSDRPTLIIIGDDPPGGPLLVSLNQAVGTGADGKGGGIWVDEGARLSLIAARLELNDSVNGNGGAIAATGGSRVLVGRVFGTCHTPLECSAINNNRAGDTGGAVFARGPDTTVLLERTVIRNNAGESGAGADLFAAIGSIISLTDSLVYRGAGPNGLFFDPSDPNQYTVWIENNAALMMSRSTMADTHPESAVIRFGGSDSAAFLTHSIIHEQGGADIERTNAANTPHIESKCVMWHSDALTSLGGTGSHADNSVADPQFVNRDAMNFQLQRNSPAVDYCEAPEIPLWHDSDFLWRPRGVQIKETVLHGPWDLGAFEVQPDALFSDRFEE